MFYYIFINKNVRIFYYIFINKNVINKKKKDQKKDKNTKRGLED